MPTDDGWLTVQQVADYAGVSGSMVRGRWCSQWEVEGLAKKILREGRTQHEWRIHPVVLEQLHGPAGAMTQLEYNAALARGDKPGPSRTPEEFREPAPALGCRVVRGNLTIEGNKVTLMPDGTIIVE